MNTLRLDPRVKQFCISVVAVGLTVAVIAFLSETGHLSFGYEASPTTDVWSELYAVSVEVVMPLAMSILVIGGALVWSLRATGRDVLTGRLARRVVLSGLLLAIWPAFGEQLLGFVAAGGVPNGVGIVVALILLPMRMLAVLTVVLAPLFIALWVFDDGPLEPLSVSSQKVLKLAIASGVAGHLLVWLLENGGLV